MDKSISVLIVEDSTVMYKMIYDILIKDDRINIIGNASNGIEAYKKIIVERPDVVTLDINMPVMSGIELLKLLRRENVFTRVLVISVLTQSRNELTLKALDLGAIDVVSKPGSGNLEDVEHEILNKVLILGKEKINSFLPVIESVDDSLEEKFNIKHYNDKNVKELSGYDIDMKVTPFNKNAVDKALDTAKRCSFNIPMLVAIGISTGGPRALRIMLPKFPKDFPLPVLISQHIPKDFTYSLISSLRDICEIKIKEAVSDEKIEKSTVYVSPGDKHMGVYKDSKGDIRIKLITDKKRDYLYMPSADYLFESIESSLTNQAIAVIMTGMGNDGTGGLIKLHKHNTLIIAEDDSSCTIFGMPRSAIESESVTLVLSLYDIAEFLKGYLSWRL